MKITDEMIERGALAMRGKVELEIAQMSQGREISVTINNLDKLARTCLEAALQHKLTEQDKLLEVMGEVLGYMEGVFGMDCVAPCEFDAMAKTKQALAQYQSYKEGRE